MDAMVELITNTAVTAVIIGYFIYRDLSFMNKLEETLAVLQKTVDDIIKISRKE